MSEILKGHFTDKETLKVEEKIKNDVEFKDVYEKIKNNPDFKLTQLEEKIGKTEENFDKRFESFKEAVLEAEKKENNLSVKDVKKKAKEKITSGLDKAEKKILDKMGLGALGDIFDKIGGYFDKVSKAFDKGFLIGIATLFGFGSIEGDDKEEKKQKPKVDDKLKVNVNVNVNVNDVLSNESEKKDFYYYAGMNILTYFSGSEVDSKKKTFKMLKEKNIKYKDLKNLNKGNLSKEEQSVEKAVENFENTKNSLLNNNSKILLKSSLSPEKVETIIKNNEIFLKEDGNMGEKRLLEIKNLLNNGKFSYEELTFNEISLFLYKGMNTLGILGISEVQKGFKGLKEFITDENSINIKEVEQELIGKRQGLISDKLWKAFLSKDMKFGGKQYMGSKGDELLLKDMGNDTGNELENIDREQLKNLIDFKNYILGDFLNQNKNLIKKLGYEEKFKNGLDYRGISLLYIALAGNKNLDNISILDLPAIYKIISLVVNTGNAGSGTGYLSEVGQYLVLKGDEQEIFKDKDKEAIKLVTTRFAETYVKASVKFLKDNLGWSGLFNDKIERSVAATAAGTLLFKYGGKYIPQLRLPGLILGSAGVLSFFTNLYGMSSSLKSDIEKTFDTGNEVEDGNKVVNLDKYIKSIDELKKKMHIEEIDVDGKKEKISFYNGEKGLEIIYKNSIYRLDTGPNPLDKDFSFSDVWNQFSSKKISSASIDNYKGKDIDFSKVKYEGDDIILGEGENTLKYNNNKIIDVLKKGDIKNPKKLFSSEKFENMEYLVVEKIGEDKKTGELGGLVDYVNERFKKDLILIKVGEIKA